MIFFFLGTKIDCQEYIQKLFISLSERNPFVLEISRSIIDDIEILDILPTQINQAMSNNVVNKKNVNNGISNEGESYNYNLIKNSDKCNIKVVNNNVECIDVRCSKSRITYTLNIIELDCSKN